MGKNIVSRAASTLLMAGVMAFGSVASGCQSDVSMAKRSPPIALTLINSKPEIQDSLAAMAKDYQRETGVSISVQMTKGTVLEESLTGALADEPTDILMLQSWEMDLLSEETAVDLRDQPWVEHVVGSEESHGGSVFGFPICIEGKGLILNCTAVERALGRPYSQSPCLNAADLRGLLEALRDAGMEYPVVISSTDWLLSDALLGVVYETQDYTKEGIRGIQGALKDEDSGLDLAANPKFNGFLDTLELLAEYSDFRGPSSVYTDDVQAFAEGRSAVWFNGNWVWPTLVDNGGKDNEYTMLPFFLGSETDTRSNCSISVSPSRYLAISSTCNSSKREAAKGFLNWLVFNTKAQETLVNDLALVPAFSNNTLDPSNSLNRSVKDYWDSGRAFPRSETPAKLYGELSRDVGDFILGKITREELAEEIQEAWEDM